MPGPTRRALLSATAMASLAGTAAARTISGAMPWSPGFANPVQPVTPGPWLYFTAEEAAAVDAILGRLIPADDLGPGARETGGTLFIDRQLAGPWGGHEGLYMQGPFPPNPLPQQGLQSPLTPRQQYRAGLKALHEHCTAHFAGQGFAQLAAEDQDKLLAAMEKGEITFTGANARGFFALLLGNAQEGFFADPIYGGNQGMAGWKLVGFPGVRYDYRDVMAAPNQPYTLPPVGLQGRPAWSAKP